MMTSDYTTASNPKFLFFAALHRPFPDWVANHPMPVASDFTKHASVAFADPSRRLLPVADARSAFHSALDLFANAEHYNEQVFDRVKSACDFFGIGADVAPYAELFADRLTKSAAEDTEAPSRFAIDTMVEGNSYRLLPLNDSVDVATSAADLAKMAAERRIPFQMLMHAARETVKAASEFSVGVPGILLRVGADRLPDFEKAATLITGREQFAKLNIDKAAAGAAYADIIKEASEGAITPDEAVEKIAALDMAIGVEHRYNLGSRTPLPTDIVFGGPLVAEVEKAARENVCIREVLVPLTEFRRIDLTDAEWRLTPAAGEQLRKVASTADAKDISLAVMQWDEADQKTILRLASRLS